MDPKSLIEQAKEDLRTNIAELNLKAAQMTGHLSSLKEEDKKSDAEADALKQKAQMLAQQGNTEKAQEFALRYKKNRDRNIETEQQIVEIREQYNELIAARNKATEAAKAKIESIESSLKSAERNEALAEMKEMAAGATTSIGSTGDSLSRLEESVERRKHEAIGRSQVADTMKDADFDDTDLNDDLDGQLALQQLMVGGGDVIQQIQKIETTKVKA